MHDGAIIIRNISWVYDWRREFVEIVSFAFKKGGEMFYYIGIIQLVQ